MPSPIQLYEMQRQRTIDALVAIGYSLTYAEQAAPDLAEDWVNDADSPIWKLWERCRDCQQEQDNE